MCWTLVATLKYVACFSADIFWLFFQIAVIFLKIWSNLKILKYKSEIIEKITCPGSNKTKISSARVSFELVRPPSFSSKEFDPYDLCRLPIASLPLSKFDIVPLRPRLFAKCASSSFETDLIYLIKKSMSTNIWSKQLFKYILIIKIYFWTLESCSPALFNFEISRDRPKMCVLLGAERMLLSPSTNGAAWQSEEVDPEFSKGSWIGSLTSLLAMAFSCFWAIETNLNQNKSFTWKLLLNIRRFLRVWKFPLFISIIFYSSFCACL